MTVADLIAELQRFAPHMTVLVRVDEDACQQIRADVSESIASMQMRAETVEPTQSEYGYGVAIVA